MPLLLFTVIELLKVKYPFPRLGLKYLSNFCRALEILLLLINCKNNLILTWYSNCVIVSTNNANQAKTSAITDTQIYVLVGTLSAPDNAKLF